MVRDPNPYLNPELDLKGPQWAGAGSIERRNGVTTSSEETEADKNGVGGAGAVGSRNMVAGRGIADH